MPYTISQHRKDFEIRTNELRKASSIAQRDANVPAVIRDLVFQCCILQTSAAIEEYIRSVFDGWAFKVRNSAQSFASIPMRTRAAIAKERLLPHFLGYNYTSDEKVLLQKLEGEADIWPMLQGVAPITATFEGRTIFDSRKYPSEKNMKVLFARIGIDNPFDQMASVMKADAELRLTGFNSIRTALAHSNPPQLTHLDVKREVLNMQSIVRAVDRVLHRHLTRQCGVSAW